MFRRVFFFVLLFVFLFSVVRAEDRRTDKDKLVVMTFNAEFFLMASLPKKARWGFRGRIINL